ncbi:MAG: hypothetical protein HOV83_33760 [Catenulispora sp.]|nr:hypothetical protein [Catenulispora sp.]
MDSLIARAVANAAATMSGFGHDDVPAVPSIPVQIGTGGTRHGHPQSASWQMLILMFVGLILLGTAVLLYVVRQRRKVVARRRLRRMAEAPPAAAKTPAAGPATRKNSTPRRTHHSGTPAGDRVP